MVLGGNSTQKYKKNPPIKIARAYIHIPRNNKANFMIIQCIV